MSKVRITGAESPAKLPPTYGFSGFGGIDRTVTMQDDGKLMRAADMSNFRIDGNGRLVKRSGYSLLCELGTDVRGAWYGNLGGEAALLVLAGNGLYRRYDGGELELIGNTETEGDEKVEFFSYCGRLYLNDGRDFYICDGASLGLIEGYVPLVLSEVANGYGNPREAENLLTRTVRIKLTSIANHRDYLLPHTNIASFVKVYAMGEMLTPELDYTFVPYNESRWMFKPTSAPPSTVENYYEIYYTLKENGARTEVCSCRHTAAYTGEGFASLMLFGGGDGRRVFVSKYNDDGSARPDYFTEDDTFMLIDGIGDITAMVQQYDEMILFSEQSAFLLNFSGEEDSLGNKHTRLSPGPLNSQIGCVAPGCAIQLQNEPVSIASDGVYRWVSTYIQGERNTEKLSGVLGRLPTPDEGTFIYDDKSGGELFITLGGAIYVYNYIVDAWYIYDGITPRGMFTYRGMPAFFEGVGIYLMDGSGTDCGRPISATLTGHPFDFGRSYANKSLYRLFATASGEGDTLRVTVTDNNDREVVMEASLSGGNPASFRKRCSLKRVQTASFDIDAGGVGNTAVASVYLQYGIGGDR